MCWKHQRKGGRPEDAGAKQKRPLPSAACTGSPVAGLGSPPPWPPPGKRQVRSWSHVTPHGNPTVSAPSPGTWVPAHGAELRWSPPGCSSAELRLIPEPQGSLPENNN